MTGSLQDRSRVATALSARLAFVDAARTCAAAAIALMPLKGIVQHASCGADPRIRTISDADALAAPGRFREARAVLEGTGWKLLHDYGYELTLRHPRLPVDLDLHETLFPFGMFRFRTDGLFLRGRHDVSVFGVDVVLPDPVDLVAHAVAHLWLDLWTIRELRNPEDLQRIADTWHPSPADCARRLREVGAMRAARYVMRRIARETRDPFPAALSATFPFDPTEPAITYALDFWAKRVGRKHALAFLPGAVFSRTPMGLAASGVRFVQRANGGWPRPL